MIGNQTKRTIFIGAVVFVAAAFCIAVLKYNLRSNKPESVRLNDVVRSDKQANAALDDVSLGKIIVYNDLMEIKEGQRDAEVYSYFFVEDADSDLIPKLLSKVKILQGKDSEIRNNEVVSKSDGKSGKGFEVKLESRTSNKIVLIGTWISSGDGFAKYKYALEKNSAGNWIIVSKELKLIA